jgi:hypothetical protein
LREVLSEVQKERWRGGGGEEGRMKIRTKKRRPLYSFEVCTNCVFSSALGKTPIFD